MYRKTSLNIDLDIIGHNVKTIIDTYNNYNYYFGIVKAECYGHGEEIIKELITNGINYLAVSSLEEALTVRIKFKDIPILCLEPVSINDINVAIDNNITITIHDYNYFKEFVNNNLSKQIKVHIKVDSGMNRLGIKNEKELLEIIDTLTTKKHVILEGIFTHIATADSNNQLYEYQKNNFIQIMKNVNKKCIPIIHAFNSSSLLKYDKINFTNGTRLGIIMYGISNIENEIDIKEAITLTSEIMQIKRVKKGEFVGYDATYIAKEDMKIAIIPIGYADGVLCRNTGRNVQINDKLYPIIGKICMDMLMVKIDEDISINDKVIIIGDKVPVTYISKYLETSNYEVLTIISDRVTRIYKKKNHEDIVTNVRNDKY